MIFVGDVAVPNCVTPTVPAMPWSTDAVVVANLEGAFAADDAAIEHCLFNADATARLARACGIRAFTLANNHITDLGCDLSSTAAWLRAHGLCGFGAGATLDEAARPLLVESAGQEVALVGFGWTVIGCRRAGAGRGGVNPLTPARVLGAVREFRAARPHTPLVLFMHWDYELELYPQPMHRQLAFAAIDAGASAVVGCHAHCVQGVEYHRGAPIVYGLGNWFLAEGVFKRGKLRFPMFARRQLAFEWRGGRSDDVCHFFDYEPETHALRHVVSESVSASGHLRERTPFEGLSHRDYVAWFRRHRRKRKLLPVYADVDATVRNAFYDHLVGLRQVMLDSAVRARLKGGPR